MDVSKDVLQVQLYSGRTVFMLREIGASHISFLPLSIWKVCN